MFIPPNKCFPGIVDTDQSCFRFVDKTTTGNEQYLFSSYYREQISQYGTNVTYYINAYNTLSADNFYGEDPTRKFAPGVQIVAVVDLSENANTLTKFGFQADDEITLHVHISAFQDAFWDIGTEYLTPTQTVGDNIVTQPQTDPSFRTNTPNVFETQYNQVQPKSGDVFALTEYGLGRPGDRNAKYFEVTEILDEDISATNPLGGHYTWIIKGKRYEYSFEPNLNNEQGNNQVYDNSFSGILSGGKQTVSPNKKYDEQNAAIGVNPPQKSIDDVSRVKVFDMPKTNNTDVYGGY